MPDSTAIARHIRRAVAKLDDARHIALYPRTVSEAKRWLIVAGTLGEADLRLRDALEALQDTFAIQMDLLAAQPRAAILDDLPDITAECARRLLALLTRNQRAVANPDAAHPTLVEIQKVVAALALRASRRHHVGYGGSTTLH